MWQWFGRNGSVLTFVAICSIWLGAIGFVFVRELTAPYAVHVLSVNGQAQEVYVYPERYGIRVVNIRRDAMGRAWSTGYFLLKEENGLVMCGRYVVGRFVPFHMVWWSAPWGAALYRQLANAM